MEAYNLYLKGRHQLLKFTAESMAKSREYYEQAIAMDPNYALAWSGLADFYHRMGYMGYMPPETAKSQSDRALLKALELDGMLPEAHAMMGVLHADAFDWKEAEREFLRALELDPKSEEAQAYYCLFYLMPMGRLHEAIAASQKALELNPLSPFLLHQLGQYCFMAGLYDPAVQLCREALEIDPHNSPAYLILGASYVATGKFDQAIQAHEMAAQIMHGSSYALGNLGWAYARSGRIGEARRVLKELEDLSRKEYVPSLSFAWIYLGLGEIERCLDWFEKAVEDHESGIIAIHIYYTVMPDPLRSHPRYHALMRKMNLNPPAISLAGQ